MKRLIFTLALALLASAAMCVAPTKEEFADAAKWANTHDMPFSFSYGGQPFSGECVSSVKKLDENRSQRTSVWTKGSLKVTCEFITYSDFPAVEWVVYLENTGSENTEIISDLKSFDSAFNAEKCTVHHAYGSRNLINDFGITRDPLEEGKPLSFASQTLSSGASLPFFTVDFGKEGFVAGIGWSSGWTTEAAFEKGSVKMTVEGIKFNTYLKPGEKIRSQRICILFWQGDFQRGQNLWRRLMLAHYSAHTPDGKIVLPPLADANWGSFDAASQKSKIDWWAKHKFPLEVYWVDAGWSGKTGPIELWTENCATREYNPEIYPKGLKEVSDYAHEHGMEFLLWFCPNSAREGLEIGKDHPEWVINNFALDFNNPECMDYLEDYYAGLVKDYGMDWYRQDGGPAFRPDESPDRQGMSEEKHFEGFYRFWDGLVKRNPGLKIDNCAGGGTRIDLETVKRSICIWRSDYQVPRDFDEDGMQGQQFGISNWVPLTSGTAAYEDAYRMRSGYGAGLSINWHVFVPTREEYDKTFDFKAAKRCLKEYLALRDCYLGDYYPLTEYNVDKTRWLAYRFDVPEKGKGIIMAFRRKECDYTAMNFKLTELEPDSVYEFKNADTGKKLRLTGREAAEKGVDVEIDSKPGSALIIYTKK
ncbi:MAG: alpha-galactosidase [Abditibacteriota bacterium]|nr:alpha-galactosidase [Abditibacteriota bacterium]